MTGFSPYRRNTLFSLHHRTRLDRPLSPPGTVERNHLIPVIVHINARGHHLGQTNRFLPVIHNLHTSCQSITVRKNTVGQDNLQTQYSVFTCQFQCLTRPRVSKSCRQSFQRILPVINPVRHIRQCHTTVPAHGPDLQRPFPVVSQPVPRILHGKCIQKRRSVPVILRRHKRRLLRPHQISQIILRQLPSIINMSHKILIIHNTDTITTMHRIQLKYPVFLIITDVHTHPVPFHILK